MYRTETLTETLPLAELTRRFRNPEKFIAYCRECGRYGHCWACPPYAFDPSEVLAGYTVAWIAGIRIIPDEALRNRLATPEEATETGREMLTRVRAAIDPQLLAIERAHPGSRAFFAGTCFACPEGSCTRDKGIPCRHPDRVRPSLEAFGFDIGAISSELLHNELKWSRDGRLPEYFTLVSALFCAESENTGTFTLTAQNPIP